MKDNLKPAIDRCIARVIACLARNPAAFVSESDIHVLVMSELLKLDCLAGLHETAASIGGNKSRLPSGKKYKTMLVHKEYGHEGIGWARSDVVVFDRNDVARITDPLNLMAGGSYLTPRFILEFGTEKAAGSEAVLRQHMEDDLDKLRKASDRGYLIHLHRWLARSPSGSRRHDKHLSRVRAYEETVLDLWKRLTDADRCKVVPLVLFVRIGVAGKNTRSKVKLLIPRKAKFECVNMRLLEDKLVEVLGSPSTSAELCSHT